MDNKPNIVLVITDDQGYGEIGAHGNPIIQTPHMDRLHGESVRLADCHVGPTCAPTRAGLMTGHYHNSTGVWHTIGGRSLLRQGEYTLATALADNGYRTGMFGKWHLGDNYPYRPQDRGFQEVVVHGGGGVGQTPDYWGNKYNDDHYCANGEWRPYEGYCTDVWFGEALDFIQRNNDRPFFCYIPTNAPHSPYIVPQRYSDLYADKVEHMDRAEFYGMITCIDENLGILRAKLAELGLAENTIFIFMTDNGSSGGCDLDADGFVTGGYNAGMRGKKGSEYDGGHRVPLFIHWPAGGLDQGRDVTQLTANVDVMPTLLELCGIQDDHAYDGTSIAPLLYGRQEGWPDRVMVTDSQRLARPIKWRKSAAMTGRWRLINGGELYDMQVDPGQRHDVAAQHPEVVERLRGEYDKWWAKVSQQFDGTIPIPIGSPETGTVRLNSHDWRNDPVDCAWNQGLVRAGHVCNGYWEIDVARPGRYRFELRRWPRQEDRPIQDGIPGEMISFERLRDHYGGGHALPLVQARLRVADIQVEATIGPEDRYAAFEVDLNAGETTAQTWFIRKDEGALGAYFVYVDRVG